MSERLFDTNYADPDYAFKAVTYDQNGNIAGIADTAGKTVIAFDALNENLSIDRRDVDGNRITAAGSIEISLPLIVGNEAKMRKLPVINDATGKIYRAYVLSTEPKDESDGTLSGSGGASRFRIVELYGDYLACHALTTEGIGENIVYIAKQFFARTSLLTRIINGVTYHFSYGDSNNRVNAIDDSNYQKEQMIEPYIVGEDLLAVICYTGLVDPNNLAIGYLEVSPIRAWSRKYNQNA